MAHRIIDTPEKLSSLYALFDGIALPFTVEWTAGRDRSLDQNALQWLWANEAAQQLGDRTAAEVQARWKLEIGVPILRSESMEFRATYDRVLKPLSYEEKLDAMKLIEVSSIMKVRQMVAYLDTIQRECLQQGIVLTDPDPELASYQSRYRAKVAA